MIIKDMLYFIILLSAIPNGVILFNLCRDEVKSWIKRLYLMIIVCFVLMALVVFMSISEKIPVILSLLFIIMTNFTIILQDKARFFSGVGHLNRNKGKKKK